MTRICAMNTRKKIIRRAVMMLFLRPPIKKSIRQAGAAPMANCSFAKPNWLRGIPIPFMFIPRKLQTWDAEGPFLHQNRVNSA